MVCGRAEGRHHSGVLPSATWKYLFSCHIYSVSFRIVVSDRLRLKSLLRPSWGQRHPPDAPPAGAPFPGSVLSHCSTPHVQVREVCPPSPCEGVLPPSLEPVGRRKKRIWLFLEGDVTCIPRRELSGSVVGTVPSPGPQVPAGGVIPVGSPALLGGKGKARPKRCGCSPTHAVPTESSLPSLSRGPFHRTFTAP